MKKVLWIVFALVVIGGLLIWRVVANLDVIVASLIEDAGSSALGTQVTVSGVELNLGEGQAAIAGLTVANPEGWDAPNAFELDRISVTIDLASLNTPVFVLSEVDIDASRVDYELRADGSNNLQELLAGIESGSTTEEAPAETGGSETLLRINSLDFEGLDVSVTAESPEAEGGVQEQQIRLPALAMTNVGGNAGAPPDAIAAAIGEQMVREILEAAAREGVNRLIEKEKEALGERLMDKLRGN